MTDDLVKCLRDSCYLAFDDGTNDYGTAEEAADRIEKLEAIMRKLVEPFKASKLLFGAQHLRSVRVGDQVVEELLAALEEKDD